VLRGVAESEAFYHGLAALFSRWLLARSEYGDHQCFGKGPRLRCPTRVRWRRSSTCHVAISVRGPAALTGIVGLKATHGRIPYTGHWPEVLNRYWHILPMARAVYVTSPRRFPSCRDRTVWMAWRFTRRPLDLRMPRPRGSPLRVGWLVEPGFGPVDPEVAAEVAAAAGLFKDAVRLVEAVCISALEQNNYLDPAIVLYGAELGRYVRRFVGDRDAELHFIGKTLSFRPKAHAFPTVILEKLPLNPCVINPRKAITSANGF
jgi:hypothetical protein